jgi:hypothetical protein
MVREPKDEAAQRKQNRTCRRPHRAEFARAALQRIRAIASFG